MALTAWPAVTIASRVLLRRVVNDVTEAEFVKHASDEAQMIQHLRAVGRLLLHDHLLS
jgi:hypothetical protein